MSFKQRLKATGFFLFLLLIISTLKPTFAQAPVSSRPNTQSTAQQNQQMIYGNVEPNVPKNLHTLTQSVFIETLSGAVCMLSGMDPLNKGGSCLGVNQNSGKIGYAPKAGGASGFMAGLIGNTFVIPVSSAGYADYAMQNFGITKNAYAANENGVGYSRLQPLIPIWAKFRDIAYLFFILAFTVIGLAIMFRVKIDARTVMTIQNQIPKIIIALIMVTFSYAIAGFLIDMMYVLLYLVVITFATLTPVHVNTSTSVFGVLNKAFSVGVHPPNLPGIPPGGGGIVYDAANSGILGLTLKVSVGIGSVFASLTTSFLDSSISGLFKTFFAPLGALDVGCEVLGSVMKGALTGGVSYLGYIPGVGDKLSDIPYVGGVFDTGGCNFVDTFFTTFFTALFALIAFLVVLVAIIYTLFRVWFTLIKSFIYVLIDAMIGPLWIAAGVFPGSKLGFTSWIRHLMGHLSVFPMTFAVILLGKTIMDTFAAANGNFFSPPLVGDSFGGNTDMAAFVGFGFILSIPTILDRTRKAVGAMDFGLVDVKKSFGVGVGVPRGAISSAVTARSKTAMPGDAPGWRRVIFGKI